MNKDKSDEILKIINEIENTLSKFPDYEDEIVNLQEKVDINNHLLLRILDKLDLQKE